MSNIAGIGQSVDRVGYGRVRMAIGIAVLAGYLLAGPMDLSGAGRTRGKGERIQLLPLVVLGSTAERVRDNPDALAIYRKWESERHIQKEKDFLSLALLADAVQALARDLNSRKSADVAFALDAYGALVQGALFPEEMTLADPLRALESDFSAAMAALSAVDAPDAYTIGHDLIPIVLKACAAHVLSQIRMARDAENKDGSESKHHARLASGFFEIIATVVPSEASPPEDPIGRMLGGRFRDIDLNDLEIKLDHRVSKYREGH